MEGMIEVETWREAITREKERIKTDYRTRRPRYKT